MSAAGWTFRRLSDVRAELGESPVFSAAGNAVWWVDIPNGLVLRTDVATGATRRFQAPEQAGCVAIMADGGIVAGLASGLFRLDPVIGAFSRASEPLDRADVRFNDCAVDGQGRLIAGTVHIDLAEPAGVLYRVERDFLLVPLAEGFFTTNGIAVDAARRRLYVSDSHPDVRTIWCCDYDPATGTAGARRVFATTEGLPGRPDGAALAADGDYWIAGVGGGELMGFSPSGELKRRVPVPVESPTKLAFGGGRVFLTSKAGNGELDGFLCVAEGDVEGAEAAER